MDIQQALIIRRGCFNPHKPVLFLWTQNTFKFDCLLETKTQDPVNLSHLSHLHLNSVQNSWVWGFSSSMGIPPCSTRRIHQFPDFLGLKWHHAILRPPIEVSLHLVAPKTWQHLAQRRNRGDVDRGWKRCHLMTEPRQALLLAVKR